MRCRCCFRMGGCMFDLDLRRCATSLGSENWELCTSTSICGVGLAMHGTEMYEDRRWISSAGSDYSSFGSLSGKIKHFQLSRSRRPKIDAIHQSGMTMPISQLKWLTGEKARTAGTNHHASNESGKVVARTNE